MFEFASDGLPARGWQLDSGPFPYAHWMIESLAHDEVNRDAGEDHRTVTPVTIA